jgi:hypothetical protein
VELLSGGSCAGWLKAALGALWCVASSNNRFYIAVLHYFAAATPALAELLSSGSCKGWAIAVAVLWYGAGVIEWRYQSAILVIGAIPPLSRLLSGGSYEGRVMAAAALWYLTADASGGEIPQRCNAVVVVAGALPPLASS